MEEMSFSLTPPDGSSRDDKERREVEDLVIIGGGPAGVTAAIYAARAMVSPLVLVGQAVGGQAATTDVMENYPGFPEGVGGMALAQSMQDQAEKFGARVEFDQVTAVDLTTRPFRLTTWGGEVRARTIIVATGASPRKLGVPGEEKFIGRGVSFCATCDGFFYKDRDIIVVGGGDSAIDEGIFLTKFARTVTVVHRRDQLRATKINQKRAFANPKIKFEWDTVVEEVLGEDQVTGARVRNVKTGEEGIIAANGVFIYVGLVPNSQLFEGQLELNEQGYIIVGRRQQTNIPGVFAAGDVQDPLYRQVVIAAGTGAAAAIEAERFLSEN
jgi:thioredoxin reductase (NADPH)